MQVLNGEQDLGKVEEGGPLRHFVRLFEEAEHIATGVVFGDQKNLLLSLERTDELHLHKNVS